jgi:predicted TIM-barrel fold metal-dependent hydrolase
MISDTHVYLGSWPFRRPPWFETADIVKKLRSVQITEAWTGSFEGLLHKDLAGVNARLAEECRRYPGFLIPFGSVNPRQPDWEEDLRRCHEQHRMPGIRLHPNYHGYRLDEPAFARLLEKATERRLVVQIVVRMEDERTQHPLVQVPAVNLSPLPAVLARLPEVRLQILNGSFNPRDETQLALARARKSYFDFANVESVGGLAKMLERVGRERVLFGSHFPLFYPESALLKIRESALPDEEKEALQQANARTLMPRS